jgi:hypothetical protein
LPFHRLQSYGQQTNGSTCKKKQGLVYSDITNKAETPNLAEIRLLTLGATKFGMMTAKLLLLYAGENKKV